MVSSFSIDDLKTGMCLLVPIYAQGGLLLQRGSTITERHIRQLKSWGLETFDVEGEWASMDLVARPAEEVVSPAVEPERAGPAPAPEPPRTEAQPAAAPKLPAPTLPGYAIEGGATWIVPGGFMASAGSIRVKSNLVIQGGVAAGMRIEGSGFARIEGDVAEGVCIAVAGDLTVQGRVEGTAEKPVVLDGGLVILAEVVHARVTASRSIRAVLLRECEASAQEEIEVTGEKSGIVGSRLEAGFGIRAGVAEGPAAQPAVLNVLLRRQQQLFLAARHLRESLKEKSLEMARLDKSIEVVRLLGEKVVELPAEKKQELALQSKRFLELKSETTELSAKLDRIQEELEVDIPRMEQCPVRVGLIKPVVEIALGAARLKIGARQGTTGYYIRGGRIFAVSH